MYNRIFTWVLNTRAILKLRVRLVPFNILKLLLTTPRGSAAFVDRLFNMYIMFVFLMLPSGDLHACFKKWSLRPYCGLGRGQSRRYNHPNIYHDPAIGYSIQYLVNVADGVGQWLQIHFTHTTRFGTCVRSITMEMSTDVKSKCVQKIKQ